jgi:transposase
MTVEEIVRHYRLAKDRKADIQVLAELNGVRIDEIKGILIEAGELTADGRSKKRPEPKNREQRDLLIRTMLKEGHTWKETAEAACCSEQTVGMVVRKMRWGEQKDQNKKDARDKRDAKIRELILAGHTQKEVCRMVGCGSNLVSAMAQQIREEQAQKNPEKVVPKMRKRSCSRRVFAIILNVPENADAKAKAAALEKCREIIKAEQQ